MKKVEENFRLTECGAVKPEQALFLCGVLEEKEEKLQYHSAREEGCYEGPVDSGSEQKSGN